MGRGEGGRRAMVAKAKIAFHSRDRTKDTFLYNFTTSNIF